MVTKLLLETLQLADGGRVECRVAAPDGSLLRGIIDQSFFDEFASAPQQELSPLKKGRIVQDNLAYLEAEADRMWREGNREFIIR